MPDTPGLSRARAPKVVLVIATEWWSAHGGLSTVNRQLCIALAKKGVRVYCLVLDFTEAEFKEAASVGMCLVAAKCPYGSTGQEALSRRPALPEGVVPDLIIGHARITGRAAAVQARDHFPNAVRLHILHMAPDELMPLKVNGADDAGLTAEQRMKEERVLLGPPARCAGIGPRLTDLANAELAAYHEALPAIRIDPGFDDAHPARRTPPGGRPTRVLMLGRMSDWQVKGLDIAVRALAVATSQLGLAPGAIELVVRGVPGDQFARIRELANGWAGALPFRIVLRTYTVHSDEVRRELRRASLVLVSSRADGFAYVGAEAIAVGIPVLVSDACGLADLLREVLGRRADSLVVPVRDDTEADTRHWAAAIISSLADRDDAFEHADQIRAILAQERTWAMSAEAVLSVIDLERPGRAGPLQTGNW